MDAHIARSLAGLCFPTDGGAGARPLTPATSSPRCARSPRSKLLELHSAPAPPPAPAGVGPARVARAPPAGGWDALVAACADQMARYDLRRRPVRTLSTQARGAGRATPGAAARAATDVAAACSRGAGDRARRRARAAEPRLPRARLQQRLGAASCSPFPIAWTLSEGRAPLRGHAPHAHPREQPEQRRCVGRPDRGARAPAAVRARLPAHYEAHGVEAGYLREQLECAAPRGRREGWGRGRAGGARTRVDPRRLALPARSCVEQVVADYEALLPVQ